MLPIRPKQTACTYTRDGIRLDADVYRPDGKGDFPVLLMRQPYGRNIASTIVYAHPSWYAAQGYIVVIQDVRGRGTSEGKFKLFAHEIADGEDSVNWAAKLPGSNGNVGMYGFSYQGMTQLYAAAAKPEALKAICPAMIGYDLYNDWAYEGDAFCLQTNLAWALQLSTETARLQKNERAYQVLSAATRNLPFHDATPNYPEVIKFFAPDSYYHDWINHSQQNNYWQELSPKKHLQDVDLAMFHIGGWFDTYLRGTLNLYNDMVSRSQYRQQLLIAPWAHIPWGRKVGAVDFGVNAISPVDKMQISWFNQFLKGENTGLLDLPPVWLFEMGTNIWHNSPNIPIPSQKSYFLSSTGLAGICEDSGSLIDNPDSIPDLIPNISSDIIVHDPWRPVPSLGGHAGIPAGMCDRSQIDARSDVLTYTSKILDEDLHLTGSVIVEISCYADKVSFDLSAILSEVYQDGRVYNITQGYRNFRDGTNETVRKIELQPTCIRIAQGNALRLSLSASCFPAYAMNAGTGEEISSSKLINSEIITITVNCRDSRILLPVVADT
ncbi:CocE/NonD family hydrolase [Brunnivagina elsteri]|uniref:S15 family X-Pro dipeptidyl-peptidase n=1 Tax=Brunnivagina elsteri CCALA 953 TaxID=987040 RepID=A0A2A2TC88_9CYAN|nr:CocE/NonD family hydrolase [Calothrix elsteri]PAX51255.1 S15 family X-Pro dipeptidyl-peptidase [Calothrix elsteri CCALA 953]